MAGLTLSSCRERRARIVLCVLFTTGCASGRSAHPPAQLSDLVRTAREYYADDIPAESLVYAALRGMTDRLDPHSKFLDPSDYAFFLQNIRPAFFGVGFLIAEHEGRVLVQSTFEGSPADCSNVAAGDIIELVDNKPTRGQDLTTVMMRLRGPENTGVRLTLRRRGFPEAFHVDLKRAQVNPPTVSYAFLLSPGVGYVQVSGFADTTADEMEAALRRLTEQGMRKLVLDFRSNSGGLLDQAAGAAGLFLREGEVLFTVRGRRETETRRAPRRVARVPDDVPVVLLVGVNTASSAEVFAGALQDQDRALLVGSRTFGKGLIQVLNVLSNGSSLALTVARYHTPSGRSIQRDYGNLLEYISFDSEEREAESSGTGNFRTAAGRLVQGGGAISPEVIVKAPEASAYIDGLRRRGFFFEFARSYQARHAPVPKTFEVTGDVRREFFELLDSSANAGFGGKAEDSYRGEKDPASIDLAIREHLVAAARGDEAGYKVLLEGDVQLQKALTLFPDAEKLVRLRERASPSTGRGAAKAPR